jgi:hypothetical protein
MEPRWRQGRARPQEQGEDRRSERRRPAFFLQALLTEDIPPYLTDQSGEKLLLPEDPVATKYQELLDNDPASL